MFLKISTGDYQKIADFINLEINPQFLEALSEDEAREIISQETESSIRDAIGHGEVYRGLFDSRWDITVLASYREKDEKTIYVSGFYVRRSEQCKGLGSNQLRELENDLRGRWYEYVLLETQKKFYWATNFYSKNAYSILMNENLRESYFSKFYSRLVESSVMFYKKL